jgi:aspartate-semialdehyde dehydrogenase
MKVGFIGWRGMVGSVLLERCLAEHDFKGLEVTFFSSSLHGVTAPEGGNGPEVVSSSYDLKALAHNDVLLCCQGGQYTKEVYGPLRSSGWNGVWIDAASTLRLESTSRIVLDPINGAALREALHHGIRTFVGGNCTVSLMLLALHGLFARGVVASVNSATYQAISGAGATQVEELLQQHELIATSTSHKNDTTPLLRSKSVLSMLQSASLPTSSIGHPLAFNLLPFIDSLLEGGRSREEWKGQVEARRILGENSQVLVDGTCVRVPVLRSHSQALTVGLTKVLSEGDIIDALTDANPWVEIVPNTPEASKARLTPVAVSETLTIALGRIRLSTLSPSMFHAFTVGDQLLWGAAEPLRRMLSLVREWKEVS